MTSEICMMNRRAVVLAADSATTVKYQTADGIKERYFNSANKIVQLSNYHPVGVMIFDSADILGVPWEVVVKAFRDDLGNKSFNAVGQYSEEFFEFIKKSQLLFPPEVRRENYLKATRVAALQLIVPLDKQGTAEERVQRTDAAVAAELAAVDALPFAPGLDQGFADELIGKMVDELVVLLREWIPGLLLVEPTDIHELARVGIKRTLKAPERYLGTTGLVFAGFGDHDVFPVMVEYKSCGLVDSRHIARLGEEMAIDHARPAWLSAFAQTSMSDTFLMGFSGDIFVSIIGAVRKELHGFVDSAVRAAGGDPAAILNRVDLVSETVQRISDAVLEDANGEHATPLRRVLGALPVDEMAELAETLITLQSLKEKVTQPSESVGGPVDVAVITKNEGMVWIKRKHFFDPALNSRYMQRQAAIYR